MELSVETRRIAMWSLMALAGAALLAAVLVTAFAAPGAPAWLIASLAVILLVVVAQGVLLFGFRPKAKVDKRERPAPESRATAAPPPVAHELDPWSAKDLLLKCSRCANTFTTSDDGSRPLDTLCPHCGQRGVIDAPRA